MFAVSCERKEVEMLTGAFRLFSFKIEKGRRSDAEDSR